jgi:hypothetical protein
MLLCIIAIVSACGEKKTTFDAAVNFEKVKVERKSRNIAASDSTYEVSIVYYNPSDAPAYLNDSILRYTKLFLASWFDVKGKFDLNTSVKTHFDEFSKQSAENDLPGRNNVFELTIFPEEIFQNKHVISLVYNWVVYEGGAHNNFGKFCFVIDKKTGKKVSYQTLIKGHEAEFLKIAEAEFKTQSGIKDDKEMYSSYQFKNDRFHLIDNFAFTPSGIVFCYNPYEIAPYVLGMIELTLPYEKVEKLIKWD